MKSRDREAYENMLLTMGLLVLWILGGLWGRKIGYDEGAIDVARGKATATLVPDPDGSTRWKVEKVKEVEVTP